MKKQIARIIVLSLLISGVGLYLKSQGMVLGTKADVVGDLTFTYPHGAAPETLFNETDFKPGDCKTASVTVKNNSVSNSIVGVFSDGETESDGLSSALTIEVRDSSNALLYGPLPLSQFFTDSDVLNQVNLTSLPGGAQTDLNFTICFPNTDDNGLQGDNVVFDLKFGQIKPPVELPDVCRGLEGIVTEVIEGTSGNDKIRGTSASELIKGFGGDDKIEGGGGSDCIIGGDGKDAIEGGTGDDIIDGGSDNDWIDGGTGYDLIYGRGGEDYIKGGSGDDIIHGGADKDTISGGSGKDTIYGDGGDDDIDAGSDDDSVYGDGGADTIRGGDGLDSLYGEAGNDKIYGDSKDDLLDGGGGGSDYLNGNSGSDTCVAGETLVSCEH